MDDILAAGDIIGARSIVESQLVPIITKYPMPDLVVAVRSQRAVILAWCGEIGEARAEMDRLEAYDVAARQREELADQRALIEQIAEGLDGSRPFADHHLTHMSNTALPTR